MKIRLKKLEVLKRIKLNVNKNNNIIIVLMIIPQLRLKNKISNKK